MSKMFPPIVDLLPHAPPMVLLDEVLSWEQGRISVALIVRPEIPFFTPDSGVPAHVGLEYMAQACGVYAGLESLQHGLPVRLGFLLGTRHFQSSVAWFPVSSRLVIHATEVLRQELMGVFDCRIICDDVEVASAQLNLYQPAEDTGPIHHS